MADMKKKFEDLLEIFIKSTAQSMEAASDLAIITIKQFELDGNLALAQRFLEAMPKNYLRRQAYLAWLCDHSPAKLEDGTLRKDKSPDSKPFRVAVAEKVTFWEYLPEKETKNFGSNDVVVAMRHTINKFGKTTKEGKPHYNAVGDANEAVRLAREAIDQLDAAIKALHEEDEDGEQEVPAIEAAA